MDLAEKARQIAAKQSGHEVRTEVEPPEHGIVVEVRGGQVKVRTRREDVREHVVEVDGDATTVIIEMLSPAAGGLSDPSKNQVGLSHSTGQWTEKRAAEMVQPKSGTDRARVLAAFVADYKDGGTGLSDWEMANRVSKEHYSVAPRRVELARGGWLQSTDEVRHSRSGSPVIVWALTDAAIEKLRLKR